MKVAPVTPEVAQQLNVKILAVIRILTQFKSKLSEVLHEAAMTRELPLTNAVEDFERHIRSLVPVLTKLATAEDILSRSLFKPSGCDELPSRIGQLAQLLSERLEVMHTVFRPWSHHAQNNLPTEALSFVVEIMNMNRVVPSLMADAQPIYNVVALALIDDISNRKSKTAEFKRKREDRDGISREKGRRLANQDEAFGEMNQLHKAMKDIGDFARELSASLIHYNALGARTAPSGTDRKAVGRLPKDPFVVPAELVRRVSEALQIETNKVRALAHKLLAERRPN